MWVCVCVCNVHVTENVFSVSKYKRDAKKVGCMHDNNVRKKNTHSHISSTDAVYLSRVDLQSYYFHYSIFFIVVVVSKYCLLLRRAHINAMVYCGYMHEKKTFYFISFYYKWMSCIETYQCYLTRIFLFHKIISKSTNNMLKFFKIINDGKKFFMFLFWITLT